MSGPGSGRTGRRPGSADTRGRILAAARASFGERGFDGATIRDVAARAAVDPALVHHYFGSKQRLFVTAMEFPVDAHAVVLGLLAGPADRLGERLVAYLLGLWESPSVRPVLLGLVRSGTTDPVAAGMLRRILAEGPFLALATAIDRPDAPLRAALAGSQIFGLAMARYVIEVEPIESASRESLVAAVGPSVQRYLTGDLDVGPATEAAEARGVGAEARGVGAEARGLGADARGLGADARGVGAEAHAPRGRSRRSPAV